MPEKAISGASWRLDRVDGGTVASGKDDTRATWSGSEGGTTESQSRADAASATRSGFWPAWNRALGAWLHTWFESDRQSNTGFEEALHQFVGTIEVADDVSVIETALLRLARQVAPATRIELLPPTDSDIDEHAETGQSGQKASTEVGSGRDSALPLDVALRRGGSVYGVMRLRPRTERRAPLPPETVRRLRTFCTLAACAMENACGHGEWPRAGEAHAGALEKGRHRAESCPIAEAEHPAIPLQDATFLNAVLPFALNQARRHRESLSLLCIAIDRLSGIQKLLGRAAVKELLRYVGQTVGALIRTSDIVATLDDDRIVAVLPRAPRGGALHVAERMCSVIAEGNTADADIPRVTVSIGVATFPTCASNVYALFDAADEALAFAQSKGRNQAILAPQLRAPGQAQAVGSLS
jgi:diguanylate cyclase (GGDEF)-like protein